MWAEIAWVGLVVASGLLVVSGLLKLRYPASVEPLLSVLRLPYALRRGRGVGVAEVALGSAAVLTAWRPALIAEAFTFAAFAVVIGYVLLARIPLSTCGCAGARPTPPSVIHVVINVAAAASAAFAAAVRPPSLTAMWPELAWFGIPTAIGVATAIVLLFVVMGPLADLLRACARIRAAGLVYQHPHGSEVPS
jgi:hypothetical protein